MNGQELGLVALIDLVSELGCRHGVGIVDHIEDRIVGLKVRDLYEVPAATILLAAHADLEKLVSTIHQNNFKSTLDRHWAYLCYAGLWHEPLREDLDAYMESANEYVTGVITVRLFKGLASVVARTSPYALYDKSLAASASRVASSASRRAPASSSSSRCRLGWPIEFEAAIGRLHLHGLPLRDDRPPRRCLRLAPLRRTDSAAGAVALVVALVGGAVGAYLLASRDVEEG